MCLCCLDPAHAMRGTLRSHLSRRDALRQAAALGVLASFALGPNGRAFANEDKSPSIAEFRKEVENIVVRANSSELADYRVFEINGSDLPWIDLGLSGAKGQQVTFLTTGQWWISREHDLWFRHGLGFHARTRGQQAIHSPGTDTSTITLLSDGPIEVARLTCLIADADGKLTIPADLYRKEDFHMVGVALLWRGDAAKGLASISSAGHQIGALIATEQARIARGRKLRDGWSNIFLLGGGEEHFTWDANGEISCESAGSASIIERPLPISLAMRPKLSWRWKIDELPSDVAEDQPAVHDYLSIGIRFEDGQDLTYIWSAALPVGKVFRCPLPGWNTVETHMVVNSGKDGLGVWRAVQRDIASDYAAHIGGSAKSISHVWLLAITPFQRRRGACRYADIRIETADGTTQNV